MPAIIACPECQRRLSLPEDVLGKMVRCPSCKATFLAEEDIPVLSPLTGVVPSDQRRAPQTPAEDPEERSNAPDRRRSASAPRDKPDRRVKKRPASSAVPIILGVLLALGGVIALGLVFLVIFAWPALTPRQLGGPAALVEDAEQRRLEVQQAMMNDKPLDEAQVPQELKPLFDNLGAAFLAADRERIIGHFDTDRLMDELAKLAPGQIGTGKQRRDFAKGFRQGMANSLVQQAQILRWNTSKIRNVKKLSNTEAVVIVRHEHPDGVTLKFRWWVTRRSGTWKIYDLEDLDMGLRLSTTGASLVNQGLGRLNQLAPASTALREALLAVAAQQDFDTAERKLKEVAGLNLPREMESLRLLVQGMVHLGRGRYQAAYDSLEQAGQQQPDMPILDLLKGQALNKLGKWDKALKHLEAYRDLLGDDAMICQELGLSLRGVRRFPEAAKQYRKSLDFNPKDGDVFLGFLKSLDGTDIADLGKRFEQLGNFHDNFDVFAEDCERREFGALLEPLAQAMRKIDPNHAPVDYYLALSRARAEAGPGRGTVPGRPGQATRAGQTKGMGQEVPAGHGQGR